MKASFLLVLLVAAVVPSLGQRGTGGQQGGGRGGGGQQGRSKGGGRGGVGKGGGQTKPVPSKPKLIFGGFEPVGEGRGLRFPGEKRREKGGEEGRGRSSRRTTPQPQIRDYPEDDYYDYPEYEDDYYYYYDDEEPLPSGPTQEPPLPSGPTRRPGQPTSAPSRRPTAPPVHPALNQFLALPLLTTQRPPRNQRKPTRRPGKQINLGQRPGKGPVRVHSSLDIVDQTALFTSMDPHQEQFIPPPRLNAGALPLAFESDLPLSQFPPFRPKKEKGGG